MNANEMKMHEELWNALMDLGYSVADAFADATAEIRAMQRVERLFFSENGVWNV